MPERKKFTRDVLIEALELVSTELKHNVKAYCVGGLSMIFHDSKDTTKDVDIVFRSKADAEEFIRAAKTLDYASEGDLPDEYLDLKTMVVLKRHDEVRFDIFVNKVCDKLTYTTSMISRATRIPMKGKLSFHYSSAEDIFLFKSITTRPDDLNDMFALAQKELDWGVIESEARGQPDSLEWIGRLYGRLEELREEFKTESPLLRSLRADASLAQALGILRLKLESGTLRVSEAYELLEGDAVFADSVIAEGVRLKYFKKDRDILQLM